MDDQQREALGQLLAIATTAVPDGSFTKGLGTLVERDARAYAAHSTEDPVAEILAVREEIGNKLGRWMKVLGRSDQYAGLRTGLEAVMQEKPDLTTADTVANLYRTAALLNSTGADEQMGYSLSTVQRLVIDPEFRAKEDVRHSESLAAGHDDPGYLEHLGASASEERRNELAQDLEISNINGGYAEFVAELDDPQVYRLLEDFLPTVN